MAVNQDPSLVTEFVYHSWLEPQEIPVSQYFSGSSDQTDCPIEKYGLAKEDLPGYLLTAPFIPLGCYADSS